MPYFPLFSPTEKCEGFVTLNNFPPNNWENSTLEQREVWSFATDGAKWKTSVLKGIERDQFLSFSTTDFNQGPVEEKNGVIIHPLTVLDLRTSGLPEYLEELPRSNLKTTQCPIWRATVGFRRGESQVSYQGEIDPFPPKASLLTFHPFIQFDQTQNFFVFVNLESNPMIRFTEMRIINPRSKKVIDKLEVRNNAANTIPLDHYGFQPDDLPVFQCRGMAGIPFGLGLSTTSEMLSLEHTHPPGSLTLHGNRFNSQKEIKVRWDQFLPDSV